MSSEKQLVKQGAEKSTSVSLSKRAAERLMELADAVTKEDKSPNAINAACNCVKQIKDLLRLEFEVKKWQGK